VPELTRASSVTLSPVYAMTSSARTVERRTGISTSTPRRASLYARSPPIFTADAAGIGSSISPRRRSSRSLSSASPGGAWHATTANDDGPRGLSTSATPAGSSARGGTLGEEAFADLLDDLLQREIRGEAGGLAVSAASEATRDRRDVELVDARAERALVCLRPLGQLLPDQHRKLGPFDGA